MPSSRPSASIRVRRVRGRIATGAVAASSGCGRSSPARADTAGTAPTASTATGTTARSWWLLTALGAPVLAALTLLITRLQERPSDSAYTRASA